MPPRDAVAHLVGLQAQQPRDPYVALWSRLRGFDPDRLGRLLEERGGGADRRDAGDDPPRHRGGLPGAAAAAAARAGRRARPPPRLRPRSARSRPRTRCWRRPGRCWPSGPARAAELRAALGERFPDRDPAALAYACRCLLPHGPGAAAGGVGPHGSGHHDHRRGVARPAAGGRSPDRRGRAALPGGVRAGLRRRRRGVVAPDRFSGGHRPAAPSPAGAPGRAGARAARSAGRAPARSRDAGAAAVPARVRQPAALPRGPDAVRVGGRPAPPRRRARARGGDGPARRNGARHLVG